MQPPKDFYYYIENNNGLKYCFVNGVLQTIGDWNNTNLSNNPQGWQDIEFEFDTVAKYFGLFRTVSTPFKFVREGAAILRQLMFLGAGVNTDAYLRIIQKRPDRDIYTSCYYGKLDLSPKSFEDKVGEYVKVNTVEGGLLSYLNANDAITYDIVCSDNSPERVKIFFDGVTLADKYNYSLFKQDLPYLAQTVGAVFLNNEGDSVGVIYGNPTPEEITGSVGTSYFTDPKNANYLFKTLNKITGLRITGSVIFDVQDGDDAGDNPLLNSALFIRTSTLAQYNLVPIGLHIPKHEYTFDYTFDLAAGEKVFLLYGTGEIVSIAQLLETKFSLTFNSINIPSASYALRPIPLFQALVDKMTGQAGKYIFKSDWLIQNDNIVTTCGDALRNTDKTSLTAAITEYYIACTFQEAFNAYSLVPMALRVEGNVLRMEPVTAFYGSGTTTLQLGEISAVSIKPIDKFFNSLKIGYPDQNYDQRAGKYEYNSTDTWKMPTDVESNPLDLTVKFRADYMGIEFIRSNYTGKDSTDNTGDKQPFLVMIDNNNSAPFLFISIAESTNTSTFTVLHNDGSPNPEDAIRFVPNGVFILRFSIVGNDGYYKVLSVNGAVVTAEWQGRQPKTIGGEATVMRVTFDNYTLYRDTYTSISGVLDATIFNVLLSPKHRLLGWLAYFNSIFYQMRGQQITLTTAAKSTQLMYTLADGTTFSEGAPVTISNVPAPLFLPFEISFTVAVPFTFLQTMNNLGKGDIGSTHEGRNIFTLPFPSAKMTCKPATNDAQNWTLPVSPRTSLMTLLKLSDEALIINLADNMIALPKIQPLHWVKYNYQLPPQYHVKQPADDYEENRFPSYPVAPSYYQKWQTSDAIKIFATANGVANLTVFLYDDCANFIQSYPLTTLTSNAIIAPNLIKFVSISLAAFAEGRYQLVLKSGSVAYAITRIDVKADWEETLLIEYNSSRNVLDTFFTTLGAMQVRVEGIFGKPEYASDMTVYVDDPHDVVVLRGVPYESQNFTFGYMLGLPEWARKKLEYIGTLDNIKIEGVAYTRGEDSSFEQENFPGYPFSIYTIKLYRANNPYSLFIDDVTGDEVVDNDIIINIDPEGLGNDENLVQAIVNP